MWWRLAELDGEQTGSRRGADGERTLVMGVSSREAEASMRGGGQKDQRDGYGSKTGLGSGWPRDGMASCWRGEMHLKPVDLRG